MQYVLIEYVVRSTLVCSFKHSLYVTSCSLSLVPLFNKLVSLECSEFTVSVTLLPLRLTSDQKMSVCVEEEDRSEPPGSSCLSMKRDRSTSLPPDFSNEPGPSDTK